MNMRSPSSRCWPHEVTLTRNTWAEDADGGRFVASTVTVRQVDCSVQQGEPKEEITIGPEEGLRRVTQTIPTTVIFPDNPRLKVDDLITWVDTDGGPDSETHIIQVKGKRDAAGLRSVWAVQGFEKI
jgi:hypothetical protein